MKPHGVQIDSEEISEFVKAVLNGIHEGVPEGNLVSTPVKFQLGIKSKKGAGGSLKLFVAGIGAEGSKEEIARIEFEVDDMLTVFTNKFDKWSLSPSGKSFLEYLAKELQKPPADS